MSEYGVVAKRRVGLMVVASWALATALTGLVVWRAVAVLDDGTRTDVLSGAQVSGLLASSSPAPGTTTPSGTSVTIPPAPSSPPTVLTATAPTNSGSGSATAPSKSTKPASSSTSTKLPAPAPTPVARTWNVLGGMVTVACTGQTISLLSASPADGWRVTIETGGPDRVKLEFTSGEQETKVGGSCVAGVPQQSTTPHD